MESGIAVHTDTGHIGTVSSAPVERYPTPPSSRVAPCKSLPDAPLRAPSAPCLGVLKQVSNSFVVSHAKVRHLKLQFGKTCV